MAVERTTSRNRLQEAISHDREQLEKQLAVVQTRLNKAEALRGNRRAIELRSIDVEMDEIRQKNDHLNQVVARIQKRRSAAK